MYLFLAGVKLSDTDMQKFVSETYSGVYPAMCLERGKPVAPSCMDLIKLLAQCIVHCAVREWRLV